ncbi:MAG: hypothetical protein GXD23_13105 [Comamonadaceae bacterium]|jgi:hypothetical protein|nr:hypothetical protein [Comamonadaceae bacterium]
MALSLSDHEAMLAGLRGAGYVCVQRASQPNNPILLQWTVDEKVHRFRLWAYEVTHGGGGAEVRAADEFRIQITNGPAAAKDFDGDGAVDLLVGYSRDEDVIVAYDRRWLEGWTEKYETQGTKGSPSVQVKLADIEAGRSNGVHRLTKTAGFGTASIVTMRPDLFPAYLLQHSAVLSGSVGASAALAATPVGGAGNVADYCRSQGFPFEPDLIARYIASFLAKPFVILAGVSGTGKSKLAELVAEYFTRSAQTPGVAAPTTATAGSGFVFVAAKGAPDLERFALVPVRPDWTDNQSVLGFVNPITERYESTQALDLILRADEAHRQASDKAAAGRHFMVLDEMNLARVEYYFSDWLACTESRRWTMGSGIKQQGVALHRSSTPMQATLTMSNGVSKTYDVPASLELPTNVVVTGTVNVDETTHGFSPKVLDRAMVIEFDEVDLDRLRGGSTAASVNDYRLPDELAPFQLATREDFALLPIAVHKRLKAINGLLEEARLHFGYRAANEMALFMTFYNAMLPTSIPDPDWDRALDVAVLQKVLPRLSGNRSKLEVPMVRLCAYLRDLAVPGVLPIDAAFDVNAQAKLSRSYKRAVEMLAALRDFGFVSFFK